MPELSQNESRRAKLSPQKQALLDRRLRGHAGAEDAAPSIPPRPSEGPAVLSYAQQRLWFLHQLMPSSPLYNIAAAVRLSTALNKAVLQRSLAEITSRHQVLRTRFVLQGGRPVQVVDPAQEPVIRHHDLRKHPAGQRQAVALQLLKESARQPFDLGHGPLLRTDLVQLDHAEHILLLTMHHIVSDGWSMDLFFDELAALYNAFALGRPAPLPSLPIQYADFAVWQRQWLQGEVLERQIEYWRRQLAGLATLQLPTDRPRPGVSNMPGAFHSLSIAPPPAEALRALSHQEGATLFMTLLAAFTALLHRYSGQSEVVLGIPISGRNWVETEKLIGFFVNSLVLRCNHAGNPTFRELIGRIKEVAVGAYAHQDLPFEKLVEELQPQRDLSRNPLFQVMFQLQTGRRATIPTANPPLPAVDLDSGTAKFDLTFDLWDTGTGIEGRLEYNTDLFDAATISRMGGHFGRLVEGIAARPDTRLSDLPLLTDAESQQVLVDWNATATRFPSGRALHRLVETQVERTPDSVALVAGDTTATYRELNHRANQVAHHLRKLGVGPDVLVGICMERSAAMAVGLLAVLKAGGAYVPLDPAYPAHRLSFMLANSQASILLTQSHLKPGLAHLPSQILCLDGDRERLSQESAENLSMDPAGEGLAYVIYTSGSTGVPKGAMVPHRAICNHMQWMQAEFPLSESDAVLQRTPFSFDASVWEFYAPLMAGARLVMAPPAQFQHAGQLAATIQKHGVTVLQVVPSLLGLLLEEAEFLACRSLRRVFCGGEALPQALVQRFHEHFQAELVNLYGPTEAAIDATFSRCAAGGDGSTASIGRPIANLQAYILDSRQQPAPVGVAGELCLGGAGVGRGYLRRPALTARRFIPNPFNTGDTSRLYRTGDLARFRPDGSIAFLGRIDQQVKLRGFRIEPGEIEATLRQHSSVQDTVVTMRPDGSDSAWLAAYVVARQDRPASVADLRGFLRSRLPAYMVPAHFVFLDGLPLLPNGKVDRTALPAPEGLYPAAPSGYVAPKSELESTIGRVWQSILQLQKVGVDDNFFDLGGHSLLMVRVQNQLQDLIGREIPLLDLFRFPTIRTFANYLRHDGASSDSDAIQEARERAQRQREAMAGRQRRRTRSA